MCAAVGLLSFPWHDGLLRAAMFLQYAGLTLIGVAVLLNIAAAVPPPQPADQNAVYSYNLSSSVTPCRQVSSNDQLILLRLSKPHISLYTLSTVMAVRLHAF